jgi:UDP-2,3-diacylglucosamine pyrophosphatase LpxH
MQQEHTASSDFNHAKFTAIVSDLHLCEEEPIHPKYPLWKKYKTKEFFFDKDFAAFLNHLWVLSEGAPVELILNGDIFDFDSVSSTPDDATFSVNWVERHRGLHAQEEKSLYKIQKIIEGHPIWFDAVGQFVKRGGRVIFTIGNHDLELHFPQVQQRVLDALQLTKEQQKMVRINEWFYISNQDTLIEHGNQYDPYCMAQDPLRPFFVNFNRVEVRMPFGSLTTKYLINGMGFFNPHLDANFIMSPVQYMKFFIRYMLRAQPLLVISWLWGSTAVLIQSFLDRLRHPVMDPLALETHVEEVASRANANTRIVRQLKELAVPPAASYPVLILRELWLDRAFLLLLGLLLLYLLFSQIRLLFGVAIYWMFIPFLLFVPFFLFYARSVTSVVRDFKEPQDERLNLSGVIAGVQRVVYGHTHVVRHEIIGSVEHLNSGTWSPAFLDVECRKPVGQKTFVWIYPGKGSRREAKALRFVDGAAQNVFASNVSKSDRRHQQPSVKQST